MKRQIEINGRKYFYELRTSAGEFSDFIYTSFYLKGQPITKIITTKKYIFFGPIVKNEVITEDTYIHCFDVGVNLSIGSVVDPELIKNEEEKFNRKLIIKNANNISI